MACFRGWLFALLLVIPLPSPAQDTAAPAAPAATEERHEDHEALRALMKKAVEALNTRNFDLIAPSLHKNFTIITVDNRKFSSLDEFKTYWSGLFTGPGAVLKQIEARPQADALTQFLDADTGVTHGSSSDVYHFSDGSVRTMNSRWTVVVEKDPDGWKIAKAHFSANLLDNPVLEAVKTTVYQAAIGGLVVGLIVGAGIVALLKRRRTT
jgi:ketosteroid isomerase-like protein